jgi:hypothetical protein
MLAEDEVGDMAGELTIPPPSTAQAFPVVIPVAQALRRLKLLASTGVWLPMLTSASISDPEWYLDSGLISFPPRFATIMMDNFEMCVFKEY